MKLGEPFDRKKALTYLLTFIERKLGSYTELVELTIRDLVELDKVYESREQEAKLAAALQDQIPCNYK